ncbi:MAG: hypothetical protein EOO01_09960, partial [Chitinophagaceae bacterium]
MRQILSTLFFLFSISFSYGQKTAIYTAADMKPVSIDSAALLLSSADVIFFGEQHDDSLTHIAENDLLQAIYKIRGQDLVLSLEMFETDCQQVLDEYLGGFINEDRMIKDGRAWDNYRDY